MEKGAGDEAPTRSKTVVPPKEDEYVWMWKVRGLVAVHAGSVAVLILLSHIAGVGDHQTDVLFVVTGVYPPFCFIMNWVISQVYTRILRAKYTSAELQISSFIPALYFIACSEGRTCEFRFVMGSVTIVGNCFLQLSSRLLSTREIRSVYIPRTAD